MIEKHLTHRGDVTAVATVGGDVVFVTVHPDGLATPLYRLDPAKGELAETPLPCGGRTLLVDGDTVFVAGTDGHLYAVSPKRKSPKPLGDAFDPPPASLASLDGGRLAVLAGERVAIVDRAKGGVLQVLDLPAEDEGTVLASDPTGQWLVVGTRKGTVAVFDCEEKEEYLAGESAKLHEGAITALAFEPEELRFLSTGADGKLLVTHARGTLEPEDRGRGGMHEDVVTAIVHVPGERFVTGSRDSTCKTWQRGGATRPATLDDGVAQVIDLTVVTVHDRPHLVVACRDDSLRLFLLDAGGKFGPPTHRFDGAIAHAKRELNQNDPKRREAALRLLAEWNDAASLELLARTVDDEGDAGLRRVGTRLIAESGHAHAVKHLEGLLDHGDEEVRLAAFAGLRSIVGSDDFRPLDLALGGKRENVAIAAVEALVPLAKNDDRAHARLVEALEHRLRDVARAGLLALETVEGKDPEGDLLGLASRRHAAVRRLAIVRLFQRGLLDDPRAAAAVRRRLEADDAEVRDAAFHVLVLARPKLASALRNRDADLHRRLFDIESFTLDADAKASSLPKTKKPKQRAVSLAAADAEPLLWATASRAVDMCLAGARGLATVEDGRALPVLLQLSREDDADCRVAVCRGLADLGDPRAAGRLASMLDDVALEVRDAAFTALVAVHDGEPLVAVDRGFGAGTEDVHRRALELLTKTIRRKPPKAEGDVGWAELLRALDDRYLPVRQEAFKACLNLGVAAEGKDDVAGTLRFVRRSAHSDVRGEVLNEVTAHVRTPWGWELLLEFVDDPSATVRGEAFDFALKHTKRRDVDAMAAGLRSIHPDVRRRAIDELRNHRSDEARSLLVTAVNDDDLETREHALDAIVSANERDALVAALDSRHDHVRLKAAQVLAKHGEPATFDVLVAFVRADRPRREDAGFEQWRTLVAGALDGLSDLGDPRAIEVATPFLTDDEAEIRKEAGTAIIWSAREEHVETLRGMLAHDDDDVKREAALGLAVQGDAESLSLALGEDGRFTTRYIAAASVGDAGEPFVVRGLDADNLDVRWLMMLVLLLREVRLHDGTPRRLLACLSALTPRIRLLAAEGLRRFTEADDLAAFVVECLNDRGDEDAWKVPAETVLAFADLFAFGAPWIRGRAVCVLPSAVFEEEQKGFDEHWNRFAGRFADEIARVAKVAAKTKPTKLTVERSELDEIAFGTYVAVAREQGSYGTGAGSALGLEVVTVRRTAIRRLVAMAGESDAWRDAAIPVLVQALADPNRDVRHDAYAALRTLGFEESRLASEAIESGHVDLGVAALEDVVERASKADGLKVLLDAMTTRTDDLARRAGDLARERGKPVDVAVAALEARHERVRRRGVDWLLESYDDAKAKKALHGALGSRFPNVVEEAAFALAVKKDPAAFDALVRLLEEATEERPQRRFIDAIVETGDDRGPDALLDRLENDPTGTAPASLLIAAAGRSLDPAPADRILALMDRPNLRGSCFEAVLQLSGFDQSVHDEEDEQPDKSWEEKQYPRHPGVLARLMERLVEFGEERLLGRTIGGARWARSNEADDVLATVAASPEDDLRNDALAAVGWRLRKRDGSAEPLLKALEHRDATTKFIAAEQLAKGGRADGISVLLAAIELMDDLHLRHRAVEALGELADERALDVLLRLVGEEGHALQEPACEAIGHLGRSEKRDEIWTLLEGFAKGADGRALRAILGLRWFDSRDGWQLVRERARDSDTFYQLRMAAIEVLRHDDDPATGELLLDALARRGDFEQYWEWDDQAYHSAMAVFGEESLEPAYAILSGSAAYSYLSSYPRLLDRVVAEGDPARMLAICGETPDEYRELMAAALLERDPIPADAALASLKSRFPAEIEAAATLLGYAGDTKAATRKAITAALARAATEWDDWRRDLSEHFDPDYEQQPWTDVLVRLVWVAGRSGAGAGDLAGLLARQVDDPLFAPVRRAAIEALGGLEKSKPAGAALAAATKGRDPVVRRRAVSMLAARDAKGAAGIADDLLTDPVGFARLSGTEGVDVTKPATARASDVHAQGLAVPVVVASADDKRLGEIATDTSLPESTRLGAIEGLAAIATAKAEKRLVAIGKDESHDEELRKAAWRGLRRSKRARGAAKA